MSLHIKRIIHIDMTDTADQWELYTDHDFAEVVADALNRNLETYVNQGMPKERVRQMMHVIMNNYADAGASDTEPRYHLEFLLDQIFEN